MPETTPRPNRRSVILGAGALMLAGCTPAHANREMTDTRRRELLSGFALNVESWYQDMPFLDRFDRAARDGFTTVEMWGVEGEGRGAGRIARTARDAGVAVVQIVGGAPELAQPGVREAWLDDCARTVEAAQIIGAPVATIVGHTDVEGISRADSLRSYTDHMAASATIFEAADVFAAIEPFNPYNHPGHFIYGHADAVEIVRAVDSPRVKLNWDLFHMQRHEGELIGNLRRHPDAIAYVQIADAPDRHQPGTGDVDYANVIREVRAGGYTRPIGLEFWAKDGDDSRAVEDMLALALELEN